MATYDIQVSTTSFPLVFLLVQSADHITALNSATPTVLISKVGGAFSTPQGAVSEIGIGWYQVAGNASDSNALGPLALHATAGTSSDPTDMIYNVVAYNPKSATNLGLSALPTVAPGTTAGIFTAGSNAATTIAAPGLTATFVGNMTGSVASVTSGVNTTQWLGVNPAPLINTLVQAVVSGGGTVVAAVTSGVNVTQWLGSAPAPLIGALVQAQVSGAVPTVTGNVTVGGYASGQSPAVQVWDTAATIESGISPRQALVYIAAAEAGQTVGALTTSFTIKGINNAGTTRIAATTDFSGNRSSVALT